MMADQRRLRSFDALGSERALLEGDQPGIEQQEIDGLPPLDQLGESRLHAGRLVQIQLHRREDVLLGLSRELSSRLPDPGQAAPGDEDLLIALGGEQAGCRITEPGRGAGDERERSFHGVSMVKGESRRGPARQAPPCNLELFSSILIGTMEIVKEF